MALVSLDNVTVGSILAAPIEDSLGRILINAGEPLTEQLVAVLKKRGYVEVDIRPQPSPHSAEAMEERVAGQMASSVQFDSDVLRLKQAVGERFHNVSEKNSRMQTIRVMAQKALINRIAQQKGLA